MPPAWKRSSGLRDGPRPRSAAHATSIMSTAGSRILTRHGSTLTLTKPTASIARAAAGWRWIRLKFLEFIVPSCARGRAKQRFIDESHPLRHRPLPHSEHPGCALDRSA